MTETKHTGICIVWPVYYDDATDPTAHVTAAFLGSTETCEFTKEDAESVLEGFHAPGHYRVKGTTLFGKNNDVPVLLLDDAAHWLAQDQLAIRARLTQKDIWYSDTYAFKPHISVKEGAVIPMQVHLGTPVLWWADERAIHPAMARREAAIDAAIAAVKAEHGDWFAGMASAYRHVVSTAVKGALKAAA